MSRLIVKNLPKSITADKLRNIFSEKGIVTDVQLKYTKDGKFRHFGFVGFKAEEDAKNALEYFNNTCINASKITVEVCAAIGDPNKPKAWSKYATDSSTYKKEHGEVVDRKKEKQENRKKEKRKSNEIQEILEKHKDDPLFAEFMEMHTKGNKALWSNDAMIKSAAEYSDSKSAAVKDTSNSDSGHESQDDESSVSTDDEEEENVAAKEIPDSEYLKLKTVKSDKEDKKAVTDDKAEVKESKPKESKAKPKVEFFTLKVKGLAYKAKKKDIKQFFHPLKPKSIRIPPKNKGIAYVGFKTERELKRALCKHLSFLGGKRLWVTKYVNTKKENAFSNSQDGSRWKDQEESLKNEETVAESGRIFIRNLPYTATEEDVEKLLNKYGPLTEIVMPVDRLTRKIKGYAVVTYVVPENAVKAYTELDGSIFQGRMLHLLPGKARQSIEELLEKEGLSFKQRQLLKKKAEAASSHNWNTLFLGQNAIADIIAETYGTTKEQVLDATGKESVAVRLALGETQIVSQMREFLEESGVHLDAFNQAPKQRSKTVILVKNLPAKTTVAEISQLFEKFGILGRVVLPPSGVTAIVEFLEPSEARAAFTKLAYTKFKNLPLYLEWAPSDTFTTPPPPPSADKQEDKQKAAIDSNKQMLNVKHEDKNDSSEEEEDDVPEQDSTLFIKNLGFTTDKESIKEHFKNCGPIHDITVAMKKDPKNPGQLLSMGYGFIQFKKKASADKALKTLQQSVLDGRNIELKRSNRTTQKEVATARKTAKIGKQTGTKILVRNVPFQATKSEIMDLFKTFGEIKALRLPKKMAGTGSHRGFAFVDYYTKHDAKRAFKALCQSTHLYGRRLVLEWAEADEDVEQLRKRTAESYANGPLNKTFKKSVLTEETEDNME